MGAAVLTEEEAFELYRLVNCRVFRVQAGAFPAESDHEPKMQAAEGEKRK